MKFKFNKWIVGIAATGALLISMAARATDIGTIPTTVNQDVSVTNVPDLLPTNGWGHALSQDFGYLESVPSTQAVVQVELFALRGASTHKIGFGGDIMFPVNGTNSVFGAGIGIAYYNHDFYNATLNARLGETINVPFLSLKVPVFAYIESGGGYDIGKGEVIAQAFGGVTITYNINVQWTITGGFAVGTVSDIPDYVEAVGASVTYHFL